MYRVVIVLGLLVGVVLAGSAIYAGGAAETTAGAAGDRCCFTNPRFTGVCAVTLSEEETCSDVLGYLNNPNSVGKNYCGNTKVRGGWAQVECEE